jgi:hypothetical protein
MAHFRVAARAQARCDSGADLNFLFRRRKVKSLLICIDSYEFNTGKSGFNHAINSVRSAAANADNFDARVSARASKCHRGESPQRCCR